METQSTAYFDQLVAQEMGKHLHAPAWSVKQKLALTCQMLAAEGHESGLAGQISARAEPPGSFWTLKFGLGFDEATEDTLIRVDDDLGTLEGEGIPTFNEVLERYKGRVHLHTEIKGYSPSLSQRIADVIRTHGMEVQVTITSFQNVRLEEMRAYAPELPTGWLVVEVSAAIIAQARAMGVTQLCPRANTVTSGLVRRLQHEGFVARAWGVITEALMQQVVQAGADGMTINFPDKLMAYLQRHQYLWE
jgi:glycerophosphoryl diester phosphodiesterase